MADPEVSPEVRKLGEHLIYTNERSERMIEGLLVLARSDRGLTARSPVRLDEVAATVIRSASAMVEEADVTVESRLRPRTVSGDPVLLERLVTNLVHNAITYNRKGGWVHVDIGADPALVCGTPGSGCRSSGRSRRHTAGVRARNRVAGAADWSSGRDCRKFPRS